MSLILYINGEQADLAPGTVIAQTRQVNDLNSLENRQASYTNKFSLPKTAHNMRIMNFLTLTGNDSSIPYQKNECSLYSSTGECFVYNGYAVITDGGDNFEAVVYDGIIDLYKAIENKTLADLGLDALQHAKNPDTVTASWAPESPYRYIFADYNGNMKVHTINNHVIANMDYLAPSVNVKWLWDKIFDKYNNHTAAQGTIFESEDFTNLWLTYPKGAAHNEELDTEVFSCADIALVGTSNRDYVSYYLPLPEAVIPVAGEAQLVNSFHIQVPRAGNYKIVVEGVLKANKQLSINLGLNAASIPQPKNITNRVTLTASQQNEQDFSYTKVLHFNANDTVCVFFEAGGQWFDFHSDTNNLSVTLTRMDDAVIDFSEAFSDFSIRDFVNEIIYRFGLTVFKDKYTNSYLFLTLEELLLNSPKEDWSKKFISKTNENYITGSYAQRNWFTFTYNDKEANYNDGYIDIANVNLPDTKTLIKSKIYSPEFTTGTPYAGRLMNVYKMWDKEITEEQQEVNGEEQTVSVTQYKALDKRYYFMRCVYDGRYFKVNSQETELQGTEVQGAWFENFSGLTFKDTIQKYYGALSRITETSRVVTANLWLTEPDVANFDFKKLYYIEQLSANFLVNRINNYVPGKPVSCELLRVLPEDYGQLPFHITKIESVQNDANHSLVVHFITTIPTGVQYQLQYTYGESWVNPDAYGLQSPIVFNTPAPLAGERFKFRLWSEGLISNALFATLQGNYTIYPT